MSKNSSPRDRGTYNQDWWAALSNEDRQQKMDRKVALRRHRKYGITQERFDELVELQYGACAGCMKTLQSGHQPGVPSSDRTSVDHCHNTGRVRGLLCGTCNRVLGLVRDDVLTLRSLAHYLDETA